MKLLRWISVGTIAYSAYKSFKGSRRASGLPEPGPRGLAAIFSTREAADLAVEHLVQEHGIDPGAIFVEAAGDANTAGSKISGGDAASFGSQDRSDAPLNGSLRLTLALDGRDSAALRSVLSEAGAKDIRAI